MGWRDLISNKPPSRVTLPWLGGRTLHDVDREYRVDFFGGYPKESGWHSFQIEGNRARFALPADPYPEILSLSVTGYLVGNRIVPDGVGIDPDPVKIRVQSEEVHLLSETLDRFARVRAGRVYPEGPLIFIEPAFPLGPEDEVMNAYLDREPSVVHIKGVVPALDAAFRMESHQREIAEERRRELERIRAEEEARRAAEERKRELLERLGDGARRRELARVDFEQAARAALAIGGAVLLDHRPSHVAGEWVVRYRLDARRFECVCDTDLHIVDAGICLEDNYTGEKGDTYFTLESLPGVIREAIADDVLHVRRRV